MSASRETLSGWTWASGRHPAPAPDQPPGGEQGQLDLDLVELVVRERGVLEAEGDGFGGPGGDSWENRGESKTQLAPSAKSA
jgi:hypothetical protein